jgi:hypothetical protein
VDKIRGLNGKIEHLEWCFWKEKYTCFSLIFFLLYLQLF